MRLRVPLRRFGEHEELTNLAAFLMSDLASYLTGQNVVLDGGEVLNAGGQFNDFTKMDREGVLTMFEMMKPSK
jgi:enoyl-[acyl-carrier-protein] reductase (NADH)